MSKIDHGSTQSAHQAAQSSSAAVSAGHGVASRRVTGATRNPFRQKVGTFLGLRKLRRMMSPLQVADADLNPVTARNNEQMISDLSRLLVNLENHQGEYSQDGELLKMMINESIRRIMIVERNTVSRTRGVA